MSRSRSSRFSIAAEEMIFDARISDKAKVLWLRLDRFAGAKDFAFPSVETLANELGCSERTIQRELRALEAAGWIEVEKRTGRTSLYRLIDVATDEMRAEVKDAREAMRQGVSPMSGVTPVSGGGDTHVTQKEKTLNETLLSPDAAVSPSVEGDQQPSSITVIEGAELGADLTRSSGDETTHATGVVLDVPAFPHYEQETLTSWFNVTDGEPWVRAWNVVNATPTAVEYDPQVHLNSYLIRCKEQRQRPRADLWMRWFIEDREKYARSLAADEERQQNHLDPQEREERDNRRLPPADWGVPTTEGEA